MKILTITDPVHTAGCKVNLLEYIGIVFRKILLARVNEIFDWICIALVSALLSVMAFAWFVDIKKQVVFEVAAHS